MEKSTARYYPPSKLGGVAFFFLFFPLPCALFLLDSVHCTPPDCGGGAWWSVSRDLLLVRVGGLLLRCLCNFLRVRSTVLFVHTIFFGGIWNLLMPAFLGGFEDGKRKGRKGPA